MTFPAIAWSDEGFIVHHRTRVPTTLGPVSFATAFAVGLHDGDPLDRPDPNALVVRWKDLEGLAAPEPWPRLEVHWRYPGGVGVDRFPSALEWGEDSWTEQVAFDRLVEALFEHCARHVPTRRLERGWLEDRVADWERVKALPKAVPMPDQGAYRSGPAHRGETVVARREKASSMEVLLYWLASSPEQPWREHPREVLLTEDHLYVGRRDGSCWRVPLDALRRRSDQDRPGDGVYQFGRRTRLVLPPRRDCPVEDALDRRLGFIFP